MRTMLMTSLMVSGCAVGSGSVEVSKPTPTDTAASGTPEPSDSDADADVGPDTGATDPYEACTDAMVAALDWYGERTLIEREGDVELAQTHVLRADEERWAPPLIAHRSALFLFTPQDPIDAAIDARISAWKDGELIGVLPLQRPEELPAPLEQDLTDVPLEPWSDSAWSVMLPWQWVEEGTQLTVGIDTGDAVFTHHHTLAELGAPQRFTIARSKMVLFGEGDYPTATQSAERIGQDFFASVPVSSMRWVDSAPWRLDEIVVRAEGGPVLVRSEGERLSTTSDPDRWHILKHQFAIAMSLANTGRGLAKTSGGDSSPYSFGTSVGSGWVRNDDGTYSDLDNAPYAAGWTGWTAMWLGECANVFIHEIGHSFTLAHFTEGTGASWGIGDEYPEDGVNLASHPWGFDSTRSRFRTWYRVNGDGPVMTESGSLQGKRDPMNGGESADAASCFPQYTAYHAWQIQDWSQSRPTITSVDDTPGIYTWDPDSRAMVETGPVEAGSMNPVAIDVPVTTVIGTLAHRPESSRVYPPIHWSSGNAFAYVSPTDGSTDAHYDGANYYIAVEYEDGTVERRLIAQPAIPHTDTDLYLWSVNLESNRSPARVTLFQTLEAHPSMDIETASPLHSIELEPATESTPPPVRMGNGFMANGALYLTDWCEAGLNCASRSKTSEWANGTPALHFVPSGSELDAPAACSEDGTVTELSVPIKSQTGETLNLTVHAQRTVKTAGHEWAGNMQDGTPWIDAANVRQGVRVWIPFAPNAELPPGTWSNAGPFSLTAMVDGAEFASVPVVVNLTILPTETVDIATPYEGASVTTEGSSSFFTVEDASMGPTDGVWWGTSESTPLTIPVRNADTGESTHLRLDAWKRSCDLGWGTWWNLNAAQVADGSCAQWPQMTLAAEGNEHLESGQTYESPPSWPLVLRGHAWHLSQAIVDTRAIEFTYTVP